jgi:hypothetical protein
MQTIIYSFPFNGLRLWNNNCVSQRGNRLKMVNDENGIMSWDMTFHCCQSCWKLWRFGVKCNTYVVCTYTYTYVVCTSSDITSYKIQTHSIFGESRLVLLVSLIRASVLNFMFCIVYVWLVDDSFPCYIIGNVIWVIENSLVNLYAGLYGWGLFHTSLVCLRDIILCKLWVRVLWRGGGRDDCGIFSMWSFQNTKRNTVMSNSATPTWHLKNVLCCSAIGERLSYISSSSLHKI